MARRVARKKKRKLSTAAWFGIGCGGVVVLGLIVVGVLWLMATSEPPLPPEARTATTSSDTGTSSASDDSNGGATPSAPSSSTSPSQTAQRSAPPLEQQMQYVQRAERSDQPVQVTMTIRESELNSMLAERDTGQVRDLKVYFGDGSIAATGVTDYRGRSVHLTVRGRPVVSGGDVSIEITEVLVGRLTAPQSVHDQVRKEFNSGIRRLVSKRNMRIESARVSPDVMTLTGWVGGT